VRGAAPRAGDAQCVIQKPKKTCYDNDDREQGGDGVVAFSLAGKKGKKK
jgi:hypothetical protein